MKSAHHRTRQRGFTLIEMLVTTAIIGTLAALATVAIMYGTGKARANNALFELSSMVSVAQMRAMSTRIPHYLVVWEQEDALGAFVIERADPPAAAAVDWLVVDPQDQDALEGRRVVTLPLSVRGGVAPFPLESLSAYGITTPLLMPFSTVPTEAVGGSPLLNACSFCVPGGPGAIGVIRFNSGGDIEVITGAEKEGATLAIAEAVRGENAVPRLIAIAAPSATLKVYR